MIRALKHWWLLLVTAMRRSRCSHRFDYADVVSRKTLDGNVTWPCWKCGKVFSEQCGLDVLSKSNGEIEEKVPKQ